MSTAIRISHKNPHSWKTSTLNSDVIISTLTRHQAWPRKHVNPSVRHLADELLHSEHRLVILSNNCNINYIEPLRVLREKTGWHLKPLRAVVRDMIFFRGYPTLAYSNLTFLIRSINSSVFSIYRTFFEDGPRLIFVCVFFFVSIAQHKFS